MLKLYSFHHLDSWKPMKILAKTGAKGDPMATPSIWLQSLPLKIYLRKYVCDEAKRKSSFLVTFRFGLWLTNTFVAMPMVSGSGILVKRLVIL